jgi:ParB-like chromosome segregation protein Spo0J
VAASIREFGFRQPIVVDADGVIICGHTRYKAALKLGLDKVPVHVAKDLTPEQIKAYRIADNKTASLATWNYDLLPIELGALKEANYDLALLGFDPDELAKLLDPTLKDGLTDPNDVPHGGDADSLWEELWNELHHQGDIGEASYAALPQLVHICQTRKLIDWNLFALAATIEVCRRRPPNPPVPE